MQGKGGGKVIEGGGLNVGYRLQVTGYRLQVTGYRLQVAGYTV